MSKPEKKEKKLVKSSSQMIKKTAGVSSSSKKDKKHSQNKSDTAVDHDENKQKIEELDDEIAYLESKLNMKDSKTKKKVH